MCEFLSWIEKSNKVYFLTKKQADSPQGEMLKKRFPGDGELIGHAAIRAYYDIADGEDRECNDFSTPKNFPSVLVKAIKRGDFKGFGEPKGLLRDTAWKAYEEATAPAWKAYEEATAPVFWDLFAILENRAKAWR